jgi:hypothetical protein
VSTKATKKTTFASVVLRVPTILRSNYREEALREERNPRHGCTGGLLRAGMACLLTRSDPPCGNRPAGFMPTATDTMPPALTPSSPSHVALLRRDPWRQHSGITARPSRTHCGVRRAQQARAALTPKPLVGSVTLDSCVFDLDKRASRWGCPSRFRQVRR